MKRLAIVVAFLSLALTALAFAADGGGKPGPKFEERRAAVIKNIDNRISTLQEEKACVQAAKDWKEVEKCKETRLMKLKKLQSEEDKILGGSAAPQHK